MTRLTLIVAVTCLGAAVSAHAVGLATDGNATATIITHPEATLAEQTAAQELAHYLELVTGDEFAAVTEADAPAQGARIFLGHTQFAAQQGIDPEALAAEEWIIRTVGNDLVLTGGRPRGTLYAVYRFLEDVVGVHWWNPWGAESVPSAPTLDVGALDLRGKPVLNYRDIYMLYGHDGGRFAARNRLNREGDARIAAEYGGCLDYGPPYHVHTFYMYIPPARYFEQHPEWFSLIDGKRMADRHQLCLTNEELREVFLGKLREYIRTSWAAAAEQGAPPPLVFSISANDWYGQCKCNDCQAIAQAEESEAGVLLDFVNYMADGIKDEYPDVFIDTLAYMHTQKAPKTVKPRDNVIIRLCDTHSNFTKPITHPENEPFREHLLSWAAIAKNLRIWDYAVTYARPYGLPMPSAHTYPVDYRFYAENNVEGVFTEHEYPILADMRDFKVWMMMKLKEDPYRDYDELVRTFTDGFYGPAGAQVREYLAKLEAASEVKSSYLSMGASPQAMRYLDLEFVREAHDIFDRAERVLLETGDDPTLLLRLRHARLPLDRATVILFPRLVSEWVGLGNEPQTMPLDRDAIAERARETRYAVIAERIPEGRQAHEREAAEDEFVRYTAFPVHVPLPARFRDLPPGTVFDFPAHLTRNWQDIVKVVKDADTETGITNRLEFPTGEHADRHPLERYKLPMPWGLYDQVNKRGMGSGSIRPDDVPGPGYHWYKMGTFSVAPSVYIWFFWSWIIQLDVDSVVDPENPDQRFDIWARIKFEGPEFPHGNAEDKNAICVERVVLVKEGAEGQ